MRNKHKIKRVSLASVAKSIDDLAMITKRGFDHTAPKEAFATFEGEFLDFRKDMTDFRKKTGATLFNLDAHAQATNDRLNAIEKALGPTKHPH